MPRIEVCFSPALYSLHHDPEARVVVVDVLRATTAICSAFASGAAAILPVSEEEEARKLKEKGFVVAAERDGIKLPFADFGNSPFNFTRENVEGKTVAYSTTNGTHAINIASAAKEVIIGAFVNLSAVTRHLMQNQSDVVILCAGWKDRFNLEDSLCAGAISKKLIDSGSYSTVSDSCNAAMDLWSIAENNLIGYIQKAAHRHRLHKMILDDVIEYCHTPDLLNVLPVLDAGLIVNRNGTSVDSD